MKDVSDLREHAMTGPNMEERFGYGNRNENKQQH